MEAAVAILEGNQVVVLVEVVEMQIMELPVMYMRVMEVDLTQLLIMAEAGAVGARETGSLQQILTVETVETVVREE